MLDGTAPPPNQTDESGAEASGRHRSKRLLIPVAMAASLVVALVLVTGQGSQPARPAWLHTAPASIARDCSRPVETEVNAWLGSLPSGATARFARDGCYGHDGTLVVDDREGLTIDGNGSTFKAMSRGHATRATWRIRGGRDVHLTNMIIRGIGTAVPRGQQGNGQEAQHGVSFDGVVGASLRNAQIYDVRGDFVEAQSDVRKGQDYSKLPPARDITVDGVRMERADRQGLGLTSVDGFLIQNSYIGDVSQVLVDVEIDVVGQVTRNVRVLDNRFGPTYFTMFANVPGGTPDVGQITLSGNVMEAPPDTCYPAIVVGEGTPMKAGYTITNNTLLTIGDGIRLDNVTGGTISGNTIVYQGNGACDNASLSPPNAVPVRLVGSELSVSDNVSSGYPPSTP